MNIMTKRGSVDNIITYEHICDSTADLPNIPLDQMGLGTVAIVLVGSSGNLEVYMSTSDKQWIEIA